MLQPSTRSRYSTAPEWSMYELAKGMRCPQSRVQPTRHCVEQAQLDHAVRKSTMFETAALSSRGKARVARIGTTRGRSAPPRRWRIRDEALTQQVFLALRRMRYHLHRKAMDTLRSCGGASQPERR